MTVSQQLEKIADLVKSGEILELYRGAGEEYVGVGQDIAETIAALAEESKTLKSPGEIERFIQSVRHTINSIFLTANAAASKVSKLSNGSSPEDVIGKIAGEIVISLIIIGLEANKLE